MFKVKVLIPIGIVFLLAFLWVFHQAHVYFYEFHFAELTSENYREYATLRFKHILSVFGSIISLCGVAGCVVGICICISEQQSSTPR